MAGINVNAYDCTKDELKNGRKRSHPSDMAGDSIDNPIEIMDETASKAGANNAHKSSVPTSILARSIYDEFYSPKSTFKPTVTKNERPNRYSRFNTGSPQPLLTMPKPIKAEPADDETDSFVEDSLDAMVKEIRDLLLDNRKSPVSVLQQTTTLQKQHKPPQYKDSTIFFKIYPYPKFDDLYEKTAIPPKGLIKLDNQQKQLAQDILSGLTSFEPKTIKTANVGLQDIRKLLPDTWLNDEVINFYMELISERAQRNDQYPTVHCFNTFFCTTLLDAGYAKIRRWTKRVDIFAKDMVLMPVNSSLHWTLAVFDIRKKQLAIYDSLGGKNMRLAKALLKYLEEEHMDKKKSAYDTSDWKLHIPMDIPHQKNGDDCGVFACTFAERVSRDQDFDFTQNDMIDLRLNMVFEIIQKRLLI